MALPIGVDSNGPKRWSQTRGFVWTAALRVGRLITTCFPEGIDSLAVVGTGMVCGGSAGSAWGGKWAYWGLGIGFLCGICVALLLSRCRSSRSNRGDLASTLTESPPSILPTAEGGLRVRAS